MIDLLDDLRHANPIDPDTVDVPPSPTARANRHNGVPGG